MESQPQNPEFRITPENFHPCIFLLWNQVAFIHFEVEPLHLM